MSLLDTLKAKLDPELFAQVTDALGDDFDYDLVTRSRLNTVIGQREAAKRAAQRQQQIPASESDPAAIQEAFMNFMTQFWSLQNGQQQQQPSSFDISQTLLGQQPLPVATVPGQQDPAKQLMTKEQQDAAIAAEVQKQVNQVKQQYAITEKLRAAGAVDPSLILNGGLLDQSQLKWSETDPTKLESGFDEQVTALKENRAYLFSGGAPTGSFGTGRTGNPGSVGAIQSYKDFAALPFQQQLDFKQQHPEAFQGFMQQAGIGGLYGGPDS